VSSNLQDLEAVLEKTLKDMKLPIHRKADLNPQKLQWLKKNLGRFNSSHENYAEAMELIESLIKRG
jgi:hypothetical protein